MVILEVKLGCSDHISDGKVQPWVEKVLLEVYKYSRNHHIQFFQSVPRIAHIDGYLSGNFVKKFSDIVFAWGSCWSMFSWYFCSFFCSNPYYNATVCVVHYRALVMPGVAEKSEGRPILLLRESSEFPEFARCGRHRDDVSSWSGFVHDSPHTMWFEGTRIITFFSYNLIDGVVFFWGGGLGILEFRWGNTGWPSFEM